MGKCKLYWLQSWCKDNAIYLKLQINRGLKKHLNYKLLIFKEFRYAKFLISEKNNCVSMGRGRSIYSCFR